MYRVEGLGFRVSGLNSLERGNIGDLLGLGYRVFYVAKKACCREFTV